MSEEKGFKGLLGKIRSIVSGDDERLVHDTAKEMDGVVPGQVIPSDNIDNNSTTYDWYKEQSTIELGRVKVYEEFDEMDREDTEIASALDIYADNSTSGDSSDDVVIEIQTTNSKVKGILEEVKDDLCLDSQSWSIMRNIAKYGDDFEEIVVDENLRLRRLKHLSPKTMVRHENRYGELEDIAYTQRDRGTGEITAKFQAWQVVHFRMEVDRDSKYGKSILHPIRKVYKQLSMMEDSMIISRLSRAPLRYKYLIDVDGMTTQGAEEHIENVKNRLRKRRTINPKTGKMNLDHNPMSVEEDIFIGTKEGSKADVGVLQGQANIGELGDIEYFQNKKLAGIKVPKAYLGIERDVNSKTTLTQQDVQFARTVRRLQYAYQEGLRQIFDFALLLNGISPETVEYKIGLPVISTADELLKWQIEYIKSQVAKLLKETTSIPNVWIYRNLMGMTDKEILELNGELEKEVKLLSKLEKELAPDDIGDSRSIREKTFEKMPGRIGGDPKGKAENPKNHVEESLEEDLRTLLEEIDPMEVVRLKNSLRSEIQAIDMLLEWKDVL